MKTWLLLLLSVLCLSACSCTKQAPADGFVGGCREGIAGDSANSVACLMYIFGAVDAEYEAEFNKEKAYSICFPAGATHDETMRVVVKYADDHPTELHLSAVKLVENALKAAYPCRGK